MGRVLALVWLFSCACVFAKGAADRPGGYDRLIVMFEPGSAARGHAARQGALDDSARAFGVKLSAGLRLADGAYVVRLDRPLRAAQAQDLMNRLRQRNDVRYAELDRVVTPKLLPNDTFYAKQWPLWDTQSGINAPAAWDLSQGAGAVVAILDTGRTTHSDLGQLWGYDFISDTAHSADGDGRDDNAADPGDWAAAGACGPGELATDSSWHGTHVAGTVAAIANNSKGVVGVAPLAKVQPIRVMGRCGGNISDVADAIRWAAGASIPGVPANGTPADVINLSLGTPGVCGPTLQSAIDEAVALGAVVVVAAGNEGVDASAIAPANCEHVVTVGASRRQGGMASYSNFGARVDLVAPGGDYDGYIASTFNTGLTAPVSEAYAYSIGSSSSGPQVSGVAALMQSTQAGSPAAVEATLKGTTRPLLVPCPAGCGTGLLNAAAAVGDAKGGALFIEDQTYGEGAATHTLHIPVRLSRAMPGPVSFDVTTTAGSADTGDFQQKSVVGAVIPAGQTSYDFQVDVFGDAVPEHDQGFTVSVSNASGIAVADGVGLVTLRNDDPFVLPSNASQKLGAFDPTWGMNMLQGGRFQLFVFDTPYPTPEVKFQTSGAYDVELLVKKGSPPTFEDADCVSLHDGSAEECVVTAPSGRYYVAVYAFNDAWDVNIRAFHPTLGPPAIVLSPGSGVEGTAQGQWIHFTAKLSWPSDLSVLFYVQTQQGTAIAGEDYQEVTKRSYQLAPGETEADIMVATYADAKVEANETFQLQLVEAYQATIGTPQVQGRVMNDDLAELRIGDASAQEGDAGETTLRFVVQLSQALPSPIWFDIGTVPGSATAGADYVARPAARRFMDAGRTRQVFEVQVLGDASAEGAEDFGVQLANVDGAMAVDGVAKGNIAVDDAPGVRAAARRVRAVLPVRPAPPAECTEPPSEAPATPAQPASRSSARPAPPVRSTRCPAARVSPRPARSPPAGRS